jgi:hypothetical protein
MEKGAVNRAAIDGLEGRRTPVFPLEPLQPHTDFAPVKGCEEPGSYRMGVNLCLQTVHNFTPV